MVSFNFAVLFLVAAIQIQTDYTTGIRLICPHKSHFRKIEPCEIRCDRLPSPQMSADCPDTKPHWGCRCEDGLLPQSGTFGETVVCVTPEQCNAVCGNNMHYEPYGSSCQPTCGAPTVAQPCKEPAGPRCVCNTGFIMDEKKQFECVNPNACHKP